MSAAPNGQSKAAEENEDAKANATATPKEVSPPKPRAVRKRAVRKRAATPTANPESTSKPGDEQDQAAYERGDEAHFNSVHIDPGPNDPIPEGTLQITRKATEGEHADPAGNITETVEFSAPHQEDVFVDIDAEKLPVSVTVGQVTITLEQYAGRAVASVSLVGWVGDAPFKLLAKDLAPELEGALAALRKALA